MRLNVGFNAIAGGRRFLLGVSLAFGLIWTSAAPAGGPLFGVTEYSAGEVAWSVVIGDVDGDQVADLVVGNLISRDISVLRGLGDGSFAAALIQGEGEQPTSIAIADLDGDQVLDLAMSGEGLRVLPGIGNGTFGAAVPYDAGTSTSAVAIADLNGDQMPDVVVTDGGSDTVAVLLGLDGGTFATAAHYAAGDGPVSVAISDLNGDEVPDLAVANQASDDVSVLLGVGGGVFVAQGSYSVGDQPWGLAIGDLNGDLVPDLAVANITSDFVSVLLGVGDGTFADAQDVATAGGALSVAIDDLDGDGVLDLAVAAQFGNRISVLLGIGDGTFAAPEEFAIGGTPSSVAIGDLNGDLVPDLAVANAYFDTVLVLLNQATGACCTGIDCIITPQAECLATGGFFFGHDTTCDQPDGDGDGVLDACDACDNNFPDDCDFVSPILAAAPHDILKNRYISIDPRGQDAFNAGGLPFDIRVTLSSTLVNGVTVIGDWWWANVPDAGCISVVGPTRPASPPDWSGCPTLHLTGCPIIPTSTYEIAAVVGGLQSSPPLAADTQAKPGVKWHGDIIGFFTGTEWTAPNGVVNIDDAVAIIKAFQNINAFNAPHVTVSDIHPNMSGTQINKIVNFDDVLVDIFGFRGFEYPGPQIEQCEDP